MEQPYLVLSYYQVGLAALLILINGGISVLLRLGLERRLLVAAACTVVQLLLIGLVLEWVFRVSRWYVVLALMLAMTLIAGVAATQRARFRYPGIWLASIASVWASSWVMGSLALFVLVRVRPWYAPQYAIPLLGMILGNTLNGISLGLDRLGGELAGRRAQVEAALALGATRWEAAREPIQQAVRTGLIPILNSMMVVGIVSLPGMMTGQLLAGASPLQAVKYQIVIMFLIASGTALGTVSAVLLSYRRLFNSAPVPLPARQGARLRRGDISPIRKRSTHEPDRLRHAAAADRHGARGRRRPGQRPGRLPHAHRHLPQPEPARHLRCPALRRHGPGADGGAAHQLLRVPLPLHQRHPPRREPNIQGVALMKLFFHPGTDMAQAMAETIGYVTRSRAFMPPGTVSPFVMRFDAGSVPVGYLVLSSETKSIGEIQDQALFKVRPMFASLPGVSAPPPFGGNQRTVVVRVDPDRLRSYQMSPDEVIDAITAGNTISPSGNVRIGDKMPIVPINSLVRQVKELETIPIRPGQDPTVYIRDVAHRPGRQRHPHGLRAGQRPPGRLHPGDQAGRRLDPLGRQQRQEGPAEHAGGPARRHQGQLRVRPVADRHQGDVDAW